jgi:hypothetical protein
MLLVRYRIGVLEDWLGSSELEVALLERQGEGMASGDDPADRYGARAPVNAGAIDGSGSGRRVDVGGQDLPAVPEGAR